MGWHSIQHLIGLCGDHSVHFNFLDSVMFISSYYTNTLYVWWAFMERIKEKKYGKSTEKES